MADTSQNTLYFGDNLDILRHYIAAESVDLVYLDPPFNSKADYNVIFKEQSGQLSAAQIQAFTDTWHWNTDYTERAREEVLTYAPHNVASMLDAMISFIGRNDLTAYLVMMTQRLLALHRVLKPTGSLYLHCDPTASHYLKIVLDTIFGPTNFRNELIWKRTGAHNSAKRYGPVHDAIFFYTKSDAFVWNPQYKPYSPEYITQHYTQIDPDGRRWMPDNLTAAGVRHGSSGQSWHGYDVAATGRHWKFTIEGLEQLDSNGLIYWPTKGGWPRFKRYLDTVKGLQLQDVWTDIEPLNSQAAERLGYPTQKPETLLERIITASSNPGDVVLDPFCGCGTAICAAEKLGRRWIGIDVTHLAVSLMKNRLKTMFGLEPNKDYQVVGEPKDVSGAQELAQQNRYQFQYWAVSLVEGMAQEQQEKKKGADKGIDGIISFMDGPNRRRETAIIQVKSGHVTSSHIRDLKGVLDREKAAMGLYICLEKPTRDMLEEASSAGFYASESWAGPKGDHRWPRIQIRTIEELLAGHTFEIPPRPIQFKPAARVTAQPTMPGLWTSPAATGADTVDIDLPETDDDEELAEDVQ